MKREFWTACRGVLAGATLSCAFASGAYAADHNDPPAVADDDPVDIADIFAWHEGDKLIAILTFAGPTLPFDGQQGVYNSEVDYYVNIDNNGDNEADIQVRSFFMTDENGATTVTVENLPGASGPVAGLVESTIDAAAGLQVFAGLRDDPFAFDLQGFVDTLNTGSLMFDNSRDHFAGQNVTAIVLEMDLATATGGSDTVQVWASTER